MLYIRTVNDKLLQPLKLVPTYKDYLWGGDRIPRHFGRALPPGIYAESWEVSDRPEGMSVVSEGPFVGRTLAELVRTHGEDLLGRGVAADRFPLLVKLIDAKQALSVQVHPNDASAAQFGGEAKTEMWYVLAADPGAFVYCGFKPGVDEAALRVALKAGGVEDLLKRIPVAAGDAVFMPGGCVHAIGAGCLLYECQQNSNTTYRLYDFGRLGPDGKPRALHIEESIKVIDWNPAGAGLAPSRVVASMPGGVIRSVVASPYFSVERLDLSGTVTLPPRGAFTALFVAHGELTVRAGGAAMRLHSGETGLIPAAVGRVDLTGVETSTILAGPRGLKYPDDGV